MATFLTGLFAILPIAITFSIINWLANWFQELIGPETIVGRSLRSLGLHFVTNEIVATLVGWVLVVAGIWGVGLIVRGTAGYRLQEWFHSTMKRIPLVRSVYGPVQQVVAMFAKQDQSDMAGMSVVYCQFGAPEGGGILGLLASSEVYRFQEEPCHVIYLPSSPVPMTGYTLFVPQRHVHRVDMDVEGLMQIYLSLGVMTSGVVPAKYQMPHPSGRSPSPV